MGPPQQSHATSSFERSEKYYEQRYKAAIKRPAEFIDLTVDQSEEEEEEEKEEENGDSGFGKPDAHSTANREPFF